MDIAIAQKRIDDLAGAMLAKGMPAPEVTAMLISSARPCVYLKWRDESQPYNSASNCFHSDTMADAFDKASAFIAARPSPEQAQLNEFLAVLGKAVALGKKYDIDADYLNPLVASMRKLSENIITDQRAA